MGIRITIHKTVFVVIFEAVLYVNHWLSLPADQHLLQWWPAALWSSVYGLPSGWRATCGNTGSILHCILPGPHGSDGVVHFHHHLPCHGTTFTITSNQRPRMENMVVFLKWTFYADFLLLMFYSWALLDLHESQFKKLLISLKLCLSFSTSVASLSEASCLSFSPFSPCKPTFF